MADRNTATDRKREWTTGSAPGSPVDERRFRALFDENFTDLWHFARRRCVSPDDADDVAAETFAVAWRRRDDLPAGDGVRPWLFGTARWVLANQRRSTVRRDRLHRRVEVIAPTLAPAPDPADVVADRYGDPLLAALATLGDDDQEVLVLRAWDGLAVADIASLLDVTPNAVSVRLSKARARLAAALDRTDPPPARTDPGQATHLEGGAS